MKSTDLLEVGLGRESRLVWDNALVSKSKVSKKNLNRKTSCTYLRLGPLSYDPTGIMLASLVLLCNAVNLALLCSWENQALEKICLFPSMCYPNPGGISRGHEMFCWRSYPLLSKQAVCLGQGSSFGSILLAKLSILGGTSDTLCTCTYFSRHPKHWSFLLLFPDLRIFSVLLFRMHTWFMKQMLSGFW